LKGKWGLTAFVGLGCLYGDNLAGRSLDCTDSDNQFPSIGGGLTYQLKPEERIIVKLEAAAGKEGNYGFYLSFGNSF
jgi:hypothetical protein